MPKKLVFNGVFKDIIFQYIEYKKACGYAYDYDYSKRLRQMNDFFEQNYKLSKIALTKEMVLNFIKKRDNETNSTISVRCSIIRGFATFLLNQGYSDIYILPNQYIPKKSTNFMPFIFSKEQIDLLCNIIDNHKFGSKYLNERKIFSTLIRLLYGCGLRISEALSLKVSEINFTNSIIHIVSSKNNCSRIVCMSDSLSNYIKKYIYTYKLHASDLLFPNPYGKKYSQSSVYKQFKKFFKLANIYTTKNATPRVHDLRHSYAVHALQKMVDAGMDTYCTLPFLSSFLGHVNIQSTEIYLRLVETNFKEVLDNNSSKIFPEVCEDE
jgi:site-specific recombinase XerD